MRCSVGKMVYIFGVGLAFGPLLSQFGVGQALIHGKVEGNTYSDQRFGLRFTFPSSLEPQTSLNGMPVGTGEKTDGSEFLLEAMEKPNGQVRSGVMITADPKGAGGAADARQFLKLMLVQGMGVKSEPEILTGKVAGRDFFRSNVGGGASPHFYGTQLATSCNGHFLVFLFSASTQAKVEELLHSMDTLEMKCLDEAK